MKWQVFSTQEAETWSDVIRALPRSDIYFLPEYHRAYELNGDGQAYAFFAQDNDDLLFYPFLLRPIKQVKSQPVTETWYDLETVYGYSGPLGTTTRRSFLHEAWLAFSEWCQQKRVVAEFIRFNPLLENHQYMDDSGQVVLDRDTVIVRLDCSEEELWQAYPSTQRNMIRKASKRGLVCKEISVIEGIGIFQKLYHETMNYVGAHDYYHFSEIYFNYLCDDLSDRLRLFAIQDQNSIVAIALFFVYGDQIHYHLAGSDLNYRKFAPNNLLLHTVALWGQERQFRWLYLGGGRTPAPDDSLFRFKAKISRLRLPFYIGKRLHNREVYESLCAEWMRQTNLTQRPNYFLLYRLEDYH